MEVGVEGRREGGREGGEISLQHLAATSKSIGTDHVTGSGDYNQ